MLASDLYLHEHWNALRNASNEEEKEEEKENANITDIDARRATLFAEYLSLGVSGRWPYHQRAQAQAFNAEAWSAETRRAVAASRSVHERAVARELLRGGVRAWVRTHYAGSGGDRGRNLLDAFAEDPVQRDAFLGWEQRGGPGSPALLPILDAEERYSSGDGGGGADESWRAVLLRLPELVESLRGAGEPGRFHARIQAQLAEIEAELAEMGDADDEMARTEICDTLHPAVVTGCFWVQDARASETAAGPLLVWVDERGRVVRENRAPDLGGEEMGLLEEGVFEDTRLWNAAWVGEDYPAGGMGGYGVEV